MKKSIFIALFLLICIYLHGQESVFSAGPLYLRYVSGEISIENLYRNQYSSFNDIKERQNSLYFIGGLKLNLNSYLYDPGIISVTLSTEYNPETRDEKYLLVPDRSEARSLKKLKLQADIFSGKTVSLKAFADLNQNYFNRELLTNIKANNRRYGGNLSFNNRYLPLTLTYLSTNWEQTETLTGRVFNMKKNNLEARVKKSFTENDNNEISFSREGYDYSYSDIHKTKNLVNRLRASNNIYFDKERRNSFSSRIAYIKQQGYYQFSRVEANEKIALMISDNLKTTGIYNYHLFDYNSYLLSQHRISGDIDHKLYESLRTTLNIEYTTSNHDLYNENNLRTGASITYTKKIGKQRLNISYNYFRHYLDMTSESTNIIIRDEEHTVSDAEILILDKPYAEPSSVVIKDITGTIIYQEGTDYLISVIDNYIEVQRIPGGLIANNQRILVDYTALQPGSYSFNSVNNNLSVSIILFSNKFELYYRGFAQDYKNIRYTDYLVLNYYTRNMYGARINLDFISAGIEYDLYKSTIIPYERFRYYLNMNKTFNDRFRFSINCNVKDYKIIDNDLNHRYYNISARWGYIISPGTRIVINAGYLKQKGRNIDLDLFTSKAEIQTSFRKFYIKAGIHNYLRHYLDSEHIFYGTYIELSRKF
ncbi:MAG: hypothetical protein K9J25_05415 [Bacteroidales bacterium]|nr:hypothetical protein [Bacteroidales bacterium]